MRILHHLRRALKAIRRAANPRSHGEARSNRWRTVARHHLAGHPDCIACGSHGSRLRPNQVHHETPFHERPDLELDPGNLVTLCPCHHKVFGHADCWRSCNPHVREDSAVHRRRVEERD